MRAVFCAFLLLAPLALAQPALSQPAVAAKARIAIVIDDVGYSKHRGMQLIALPGPVALAFLPDGSYTPELAKAAAAAGKPVLLHAPMQAIRSVDFRPRCHQRAVPVETLMRAGFEQVAEADPDPVLKADVANTPPCAAGKLLRTELSLGHSEQEFQAVLTAQFARVPGAIGMNNHEGSRLTQDERAMNWVMDALTHSGTRFFLDSRTSGKSIAFETAVARRVPALKRDVFLDNVVSARSINRHFDQLLRIALKHGEALAIGHPYPVTISVLKARLEALDHEIFELVSPEALLTAPELPLLRASLPDPLPGFPVKAVQLPPE